MQVTGKGQITIPANLRDRFGLLPHTEVECQAAGDHLRIRKARRNLGLGGPTTGAIKALRGTADAGMTTYEILALTRDLSSPPDSLK